MGIVKTKGIIIAENNMGDFDKMVTILTPNGKIACSAKGARRPKSQLMAGTQFLCFGEYMMFKGTNTYTLNSCETIELFYNLRIDLDKLNVVAHITKIIQDVTDENQNTYKILQLYLNTLYVIANETKEINYFSFKDNGLKCNNCSKQDTGTIVISESTKNALKYICVAPAKKLYSFNISDENKKQLEIIAKLYTNDKLEKEYKI